MDALKRRGEPCLLASLSWRLSPHCRISLCAGADLHWIPDYAKETPLQIASNAGMDTGREALVNWLRGKGATSDNG